MITAAASAVTKIHENKRGASFMSSNLNKTRKELPYDVRTRPCGKAPHRESYQGQRSKNIYLKIHCTKRKTSDNVESREKNNKICTVHDTNKII